MSRSARFLRLLGSTLDPRAWAHLVKVVNYYNYSHVQPLRAAQVHPTAAISPTASFANGANIRIGAHVTIGAENRLWAGPGAARIEIGRDCLFGPDVMITAAGYRYGDGTPLASQRMDEADVVIGRDCWIGRGVTILPGAIIGDGAIVAANSVVRGTVPPRAVVAGVPARTRATREITPN